MQSSVTFFTSAVMVACMAVGTAIAQQADRAAIEAAVNDNPYRTEAQMARDQYRHPVETLSFFGLRPDMTVAEALPGWYTEILAQLVKDDGSYIAIHRPPEAGGNDERNAHEWRDTYIDDSGKFGARAFARFQLQPAGFAAPNSVDAVLVIRALHGAVYDGVADEVLDEIYRVLKPGGVLGIVQHREDPDSDNTPYDRRGYLKERFVVGLVESAGFELAGRSEINANPDDTKDYEIGVWALPPRLYYGEEGRAKFLEIGESDRMTLKFVKPAEREERRMP